MSMQSFPAPHDHVFLGNDHDRNERRTWLVIGLTATMMVAEIVAGTAYGSMALVADGWHMSTHAGAMLIAALSYMFARKNAHNRRFSFGTGKLGDLAGFASAIVLALIALLIGYESFLRFQNPVAINFQQAIVVAVIGLVVNLVCAWLLRDDHSHHGHSHGHHHHDHHGHDHHGDAEESKVGGTRDLNLRAAYLHVLADALTSVLAIAALLLGSIYGWLWLDPTMGVVGGLVIARWSWGLIKEAGGNLLDYIPAGEDLPEEICEAIEVGGDKVIDLHIWRLGPGHFGAIVTLEVGNVQSPEVYHAKLAHIHDLSHLTVEAHARAA
ncbi:CDF family Co(II)/Ni(II) efflux transporter DmeF [Devosia salina]|uniref:CDF family Co(II)/Ni(II) efflux transporter DmeF n=1 Tax=Devosia salina TaxID=2860336 RepID=A0ABX8W9L0_9HYPH|nr:CDF family Co(II)/Ni(II) efflux transporter DmeF [Devosia salina]QYO75563.1 CDF family Co(II)/Ni(II) efflux transporter DmeF [Devosia salina]